MRVYYIVKAVQILLVIGVLCSVFTVNRLCDKNIYKDITKHKECHNRMLLIIAGFQTAPNESTTSNIRPSSIKSAAIGSGGSEEKMLSSENETELVDLALNNETEVPLKADEMLNFAQIEMRTGTAFTRVATAVSSSKAAETEKSTESAETTSKKPLEILVKVVRSDEKKDSEPTQRKKRSAAKTVESKDDNTMKNYHFSSQMCLEFTASSYFGVSNQPFLDDLLLPVGLSTAVLCIPIVLMLIACTYVCVTFNEPRKFTTIFTNLIHLALFAGAGLMFYFYRKQWNDMWIHQTNFLPLFPCRWHYAEIICFLLAFSSLAEMLFSDWLFATISLKQNEGEYKVVNNTLSTNYDVAVYRSTTLDDTEA